MTDRESFLAAILAEPDDDTVRLVYADWLEENGEPAHAAFVRRQIENAARDVGRTFSRCRVPDARWNWGWERLTTARPWELVRADHVAPLVVLTPDTTRPNYDTLVGWHRGLPAVVACTSRQWHKAHRLFPGPVEALCLSNRGGEWAGYEKVPGGPWRYVSAIDPSVGPVSGVGGRELTLAAFPNVRRVFGRGTAAVLYECVKRFTAPTVCIVGAESEEVA